MFSNITKRDKLFVIIVLVIALFFIISHRLDDSDQKKVIIYVNGDMVETVDLAKDHTIEINHGTNKVKIVNGKAVMIEADCPDHLCIKQGEISRSKESIICLPNKVVVEIQSVSNDDFDVIAK